MEIFCIDADFGDKLNKTVLGGKGFGLVEMYQKKLPVPYAAIIPTHESIRYLDDVMAYSELYDGVEFISDKFFALGKPVLLSVRSGAKVSMPGMMDTILNIGMNSDNFDDWVKKLGKDCAYSSYCRLIQMFADVVFHVPREAFDGVTNPTEALHIYEKEVGEPFPNPKEQLMLAIQAVFKSWNTPRAIEYRKIHGYSDDMGTAVVVQEMVFGNLNDESCTGVLFTRNPSNGDNTMTGEFLVNAQGEDVVAGIRTPQPLQEMETWNYKVYQKLLEIGLQLELQYRDVQDIEFTVQDGKLYILQTRTAKRTALAAVKIAADLLAVGEIGMSELKPRVSYKQYLQAIRPVIDPEFKVEPVAYGIPASNGVVTGVAVFTSEDAVNCKGKCILIAKETTPDDIKGMNAAVGILTATGGATSHAAVVARGLDKVAVVGCEALDVVVMEGKVIGANLGNTVIISGNKITIDGSTGAVWVHTDVPIVSGANSEGVKSLLEQVVTQSMNTVLTGKIVEDIVGGVKVSLTEAKYNHTTYMVVAREEITQLSTMLFGTNIDKDIADWVLSKLHANDYDFHQLPTVVCMKGLSEVGSLLKESGVEVINSAKYAYDVCTAPMVTVDSYHDLSRNDVHAIIKLREKANEPVSWIGFGNYGKVLVKSDKQLLSEVLG